MPFRKGRGRPVAVLIPDWLRGRGGNNERVAIASTLFTAWVIVEVGPRDGSGSLCARILCRRSLCAIRHHSLKAEKRNRIESAYAAESPHPNGKREVVEQLSSPHTPANIRAAAHRQVAALCGRFLRTYLNTFPQTLRFSWIHEFAPPWSPHVQVCSIQING